MNAKLIVLLCALSAALAYPMEEDVVQYQAEALEETPYVLYAPAPQLQRVRRQLQLQGGGGGSPGKGFDFSVDGRVPVWQSDNKRHQFDVTGGYSQHLGGPYGNSVPDKRVGGVYTFRF